EINLGISTPIASNRVLILESHRRGEKFLVAWGASAMKSRGNLGEPRKFPRLRVQVPLFIRGKDNQGVEFLELAKTLDISGQGARLISPHSLCHDELILLTIPAPLPRSSEFGESGTPPIQARVRRLEDSGDMKLAAVEFLKPLE
ncbi:MAG: PilZ domain-containing protein, partial [Candidatus Acidiferrales bacterium]